MSLALHITAQGPVSEMTYTLSSGTLNSSILEETMCSFGRANANLSRIFETVVRLVIGLKFTLEVYGHVMWLGAHDRHWCFALKEESVSDWITGAGSAFHMRTVALPLFK